MPGGWQVITSEVVPPAKTKCEMIDQIRGGPVTVSLPSLQKRANSKRKRSSENFHYYHAVVIWSVA